MLAVQHVLRHYEAQSALARAKVQPVQQIINTKKQNIGIIFNDFEFRIPDKKHANRHVHYGTPTPRTLGLFDNY